MEINEKTAPVDELLESLRSDVQELYRYRDFYFEYNSLNKASNRSEDIERRSSEIIDKFNAVDETTLTSSQKAIYLYLMGKVYNIGVKYDARATQCLSKSVKLNPRLVEAWNELGESYWKNSNVDDAKRSLENALRVEKNKVTLRSLSIILRQDSTTVSMTKKVCIEKSVEFAKEAVAMDIKDGLSWTILGNAYLCLYFIVEQNPKTLKLCLSAYRQAEVDPVARGQPDLNFNKGVALKYSENYSEALENLTKACELDPSWSIPSIEKCNLESYLLSICDLIRTKGRIKGKKLQQMIQSIDKTMLGPYQDSKGDITDSTDSVRSTKKQPLLYVRFNDLVEGCNVGKVVLGKVIGSIHNESVVPFTFAMIDEEGTCVSVSIYNMADGKGVIIGDAVAIGQPLLIHHNLKCKGNKLIDYKSIRVDHPLTILVNGKRVTQDKIAGISVTSTYQIV